MLSNIPYSICLTSYYVWCHQVLFAIYRACLGSTVRHRSDVVQFIANLHTALHRQQQIIIYTWKTQKAPIPCPNRRDRAVCRENLKKIDRVMAVPHCFDPFSVGFGALLWVSLSYDVMSVLMQSSLCTKESIVLCLYVLLCLVVTKKCKYGEIKLCGKNKQNKNNAILRQKILREANSDIFCLIETHLENS